jgi:hypothetical protein
MKKKMNIVQYYMAIIVAYVVMIDTLAPFLHVYDSHRLLANNPYEINQQDIYKLNEESNSHVDRWLNNMRDCVTMSKGGMYPDIEVNGISHTIKTEFDAFYNHNVLSDSATKMLEDGLGKRMDAVIASEFEQMVNDHVVIYGVDTENITEDMITWYTDLLKFSRFYLVLKEKYFDRVIDPVKSPWFWTNINDKFVYMRIIYASSAQYIAFCYSATPLCNKFDDTILRTTYHVKTGKVFVKGTIPAYFMPRLYNTNHTFDGMHGYEYELKSSDNIGGGLICVGTGNIRQELNAKHSKSRAKCDDILNLKRLVQYLEKSDGCTIL